VLTPKTIPSSTASKPLASYAGDAGHGKTSMPGRTPFVHGPLPAATDSTTQPPAAFAEMATGTLGGLT
jgi:hypothetical protein